MKQLFISRDYFSVLGIPLLLISTLFLIINSFFFIEYPKELSIGITLDLLITIPFVYFLIIRKKEIPKITVITLFVIGIVIASIMIPEQHQSFLSQIKTFVLPVVELGVFSFLIFKARKIIQELKKQQHNHLVFYNAVQQAVGTVFPNKIGGFLATEIAVVYYGFLAWKKRALKENEFSYHKNGTSVSIIMGLMLVVLIETIAVHALVQKWNVIVAWLLTVLSIYTCLQLFSLMRSLSKIPIEVDLTSKILTLKYGFFSEAVIPFENIKSIDLTEKDLPTDKSIIPFSPLGNLDTHNIVIHLNKKAVFKSFYGMKKTYISIAFFVDDKHQFKKIIEGLSFNQK
ncbi:hypothetical protein [Tenacibaculum ovolyticum]|uniref:hypothetical protein n=1 Tax=Tenacibaculum ovolyticum TaxID=104270 RepID=UPI001F3746EF|nr:hypothetical protein [Tenacibaculum ovolyticum]